MPLSWQKGRRLEEQLTRRSFVKIAGAAAGATAVEAPGMDKEAQISFQGSWRTEADRAWPGPAYLAESPAGLAGSRRARDGRGYSGRREAVRRISGTLGAEARSCTGNPIRALREAV